MALLTGFDDYDPLKIDTKYVDKTVAQIPKDGHIDINEAESLATVFLECADQITDEIARCSAYVGYCEAERREAKASAIDGRIAGTRGQKVAGTIAAQVFGNDPEYKKSHKKMGLAEAFLDWLRTKYRNLMAAHVLCKDILKIHHSSREQGNWQSARPHDIDDEPDSDNPSHEPNGNQDEKSPSFGADEW